MAHVARNNVDATNVPSMDRLTHAVIKETSKNLKYYIDVKRRENAFVVNPSSALFDSRSLKGRFLRGAGKEHLSLYSAYYADRDTAGVLPHFQPKSKLSHVSLASPEKQLCREELNFHMRSYRFSPREIPKPIELRLKSNMRSSSTSGVYRDNRPKSTAKLSRLEQDQLINDAAELLATMVKSRRTVRNTPPLTSQTPTIHSLPIGNISPNHADDLSSLRASETSPLADLRIFSMKQPPKKDKRILSDALTKSTSIMQKSKPITKGVQCEYKVSITTGNRSGTFSNAPVRIRLFGTNGHTNFYELTHSETHRVPFLKDQTDVFSVQTYHVGELAGVTIGYDRKDIRQYFGASWFLAKISINDPILDTIYNVSCNAWLSTKSNDQKSMRDFQVTSTISQKKESSVDDRRDDTETQSDFSARTVDGTTLTSHETTLSEHQSLTDHIQIKKYRKPQHVSIGPTTIAHNLSSGLPNKSSSSIPTSSITINTATTTSNESHLDEDDLLLPPVPQIHSPTISATSSDTEIDGTMTSRTRSTSRTPSPTFNRKRLQPVSELDALCTRSSMFKRQSLDDDRPPARLEKRISSASISPERPLKNNEDHNENKTFSTFE